MKIKKELILILFVLFFSVRAVYGSNTGSIHINKVNFGDKFVFSKSTLGSSFFLMSKLSLNSSHKGNIILFKSAATINGRIEGNIYSFFSDVSVSEDAEISGEIYTLSSIVTVTDNKNIKTKPFILFEGLFFEKIAKDEGLVIYKDQLPVVVIFIIIGVFRECICLIILGLKKGFFHQGSMVILYDPVDTLRFGLISYFALTGIILIFLLSIVGFAISIIVCLLGFILILFGQASLNMTLGDFITNQLNIRAKDYQNALIGGLIIEIISFLPLIGIMFSYIFMPILCLGILSTNIINGLIRKRYYETPYDFDLSGNDKISHEELKNIILKN